MLVEGQPGRSAIGIKVDRRNRLFVAGGPTGMAFVYDARTGEDLASYRLTPEGTAATFVNDVVVTGKLEAESKSVADIAAAKVASTGRENAIER